MSDLDRAAEPFITVGQWEQFGTDQDVSELADFWGAPGARIRERVLRNPCALRGFIRLVRFGGIEQRLMRSNAMPWETGGLLDLYLNVRDVSAADAGLSRLGWHAFADPVTYTLSRTPVREIITRGPDGILLCLMERLAQRATDPHLAAASFGIPFNAALTVHDRLVAESRAFFTSLLQWNTYYEGVLKFPPPGDMPTGLPRHLARDVRHSTQIFVNHPTDRIGSLLVLGFEGFNARDHAAFTRPPNFGFLSVRVVVSRPRVLAATLRQRGIQLESEIAECNIAPYGLSAMFAVTTPSNARIEFFGPATN